MAKDKEKKEKKKNKEEKKSSSYLGNVFDIMPEHGDIVALLEADELYQWRTVSRAYDAIKMADDVSFEQAERISANFNQFWYDLCQKHNVSYAWPMTLNPVTGELYINIR